MTKWRDPMLPRCKVCAEPERARLIEADWAGGMSAPGIAKRMTAAGWEISGPTILHHLKEHVPGAATRQNDPIPAGMGKRDAAMFIRDRILNEIERRENDYRLRVEMGEQGLLPPDILDKDLQPALSTALKAEAVIVKRTDNEAKRKIDIFSLMLGGSAGAGGALAPAHLIGDGLTIEGEARVIDDDEDATPAE